MAKRKTTSDKLKGNTNAEVWDLETATKFMNDAVELSKDRKYDFIGEVAKDLGQYHHLFKYLKDKFTELKQQYRIIYSNCEANCFYNGKKQNITPSLSIMNLKSNHNWTDRMDSTVNADVKIKSIDPIKWVDDAED